LKQYDAVEIISKAIIKDNLVSAIFLQGSLARGQEDEYSNVNYFVIVNDENRRALIDKRITYLSAYDDIIYIKENNINKTHLSCLFDKGLRFEFNIVLHQDFLKLDSILPIYDPNDILSDIGNMDLSLSPSEYGEVFNNFCYKLLEFKAAYSRNDVAYSFFLVNNLHNDFAIMLRYQYDFKNAKLGLKGLLIYLKDKEAIEKYLFVLKKLRGGNSLEAVQIMMGFLSNYFDVLSIAVSSNINFDLYEYTKREILSLHD